MAITFPSFNYGKSNAFGSLIGAALAAGRRDNSLNDQLFLNRSRQKWLERQELSQRAFQWDLQSQREISSGGYLTPDDLSDPMYQGGENVRTTILAFPGLEGISDRELRRIGRTRESLQMTIVDPQSATEVASTWDPAREQYRSMGDRPFFEEETDSRTRRYIESTNTQNEYYAAERTSVEAVIEQLNRFGRTDEANKLRAEYDESDGRVSKGDLAGYKDMAEAAKSSWDATDQETRTRAAVTSAQAQAKNAETGRRGLVQSAADDYGYMIRSEDFDKLQEIEDPVQQLQFLNSIARATTTQEQRALGALASETAQAGGQNPEDILSRLVREGEITQEASDQVIEYWREWSAVGNLASSLGSRVSGGDDQEAGEGVGDFAEMVGRFSANAADWSRRAATVNQLTQVVESFKQNPELFQQFITSSGPLIRNLFTQPNGEMYTTAASTQVLTKLLGDAVTSGGLPGYAIAAAMGAEGLTDFHSTSQFIEGIRKAVITHDIGQIWDPSTMMSFRSIHKALGSSTISDEDWNILTELSVRAHNPGQGGVDWEMLERMINEYQGVNSGGFGDVPIDTATRGGIVPTGSRATTILHNFENNWSPEQQLGYMAAYATNGMNESEQALYRGSIVALVTTPAETEVDRVKLLADVQTNLARVARSSDTASSVHARIGQILDAYQEGELDLSDPDEWAMFTIGFRNALPAIDDGDTNPQLWDMGYITNEIVFDKGANWYRAQEAEKRNQIADIAGNDTLSGRSHVY